MLTEKRIREIKANVDIPEVHELLAEIRALQRQKAGLVHELGDALEAYGAMCEQVTALQAGAPASMSVDEILKEYHRRIGEIFLAPGQTPYRICKEVWALHAEMERRLLMQDGTREIPQAEAMERAPVTPS